MLWKDANALSPHFVFVLFEPFFLSKWVLRPAQAWQQFPPGPHKHGMQLPDVHKKNTRGNTSSREISTYYHHPFMFIHHHPPTRSAWSADDVGQCSWCPTTVCPPAVCLRPQAQQNHVNTILLTWPDFTKPDETFIENYTSLVPDSWRTLKVQIDSQAASWFVKACQDTIAFGFFFCAASTS